MKNRSLIYYFIQVIHSCLIFWKTKKIELA